METDPTRLSVAEILAEGESLANDAKAVFGGLSGVQINWKPSPDSWSVGQCFDHLITVNRQYSPQLDQVIEGKKKTTAWQKMPLLPGFFGKLVIGAVTPTAKRKIKAPGVFQPSSSEIDASIVASFFAQQHEVLDKVKATMEMDLEKIIIYSPVSKFVTYSLLDAYRIIVTHESRHFKQAQRVMETTGFPGN